MIEFMCLRERERERERERPVEGINGIHEN